MAIVDKNDDKNLDEYMQRLEFSKKYRVKQELQWFSTQMFVEQNAFYQQKDGGLKEVRPKKGYRSIAKARKMMRGIKNAVSAKDPRWQAKSFTYDEDYTNDDRFVATKYLEHVFKKRAVKEAIKDLIHNSLMKSNWYWQIYWDGQDVSIIEIDWFDVYLDPFGFLMGPKFQGRWIIKAMATPASVVNKKYPWHDFKADNKVAESPHKTTILNNDQTTQKSSEFGTIMVYEMYIKDYPEVKAGWESDTTSQIQTDTIKKVIYINGQVIEEEDTWLSEFPIIVYQPERFAGKTYPLPWMDPIIELNKSINRIYSSLEDRVYTFSKGRYLVKSNENVSTISNENWQMVYYDNVPPSYMQQGTPWQTPFTVLQMAEQYSDDAGGIHAESTGSTSGANIRSSSQIMQMQAGDIQNMAEPIDNLETFLAVAGEMVLELASKHMSQVMNIDTGISIKQIVWAKANTEIARITGTEVNKQAEPIKAFKNIVVKIIPGTAYSDIQLKQDLLSLREAGIQIPDEVILDAFKIGNTEEVLQKMQLNQARNSNPDIDMATAENKKMAMWQEVMADMTDDHRIHKAIHAKFLEASQSNQMLAQMIINHIKQHESLERPEQPMPAQETPPQ